MVEATDGNRGFGSRRFLAPICGLLSVLLAVMAGVSLSYALSGLAEAFLTPAAFAAASVGAMYLRRHFETGADADA
jgi:hypothetical protein